LCERLETGSNVPTTSQPAPGYCDEVYRRIPEQEPIVSIHIAHQLSGTIESARLALQDMPGRDIRIIDSGNTTWAAGLLALEACDAIKAGEDVSAVVARVEELVPRLRLLAI